MYSVFIVFTGGHNIKINQFQFLESAIAEASYHHKYAKINDAWFQVVKNGNVIFDTSI